jgi:hypothetical protein
MNEAKTFFKVGKTRKAKKRAVNCIRYAQELWYISHSLISHNAAMFGSLSKSFNLAR